MQPAAVAKDARPSGLPDTPTSNQTGGPTGSSISGRRQIGRRHGADRTWPRGIVAAVKEGRPTLQRILTCTLNTITKKTVQVLFLAAGLVMTGQLPDAVHAVKA